ncbi:cordon-bleu protein-like 1b isoform X2 [Rhincodon typus]|nr:cordon-bleu protein-like 1b isoform X2 [Rhincodon typus]XP_048454941.1 cordon-bleu protein-like 1b isoform X2 [Rhincodon typus]XP_048454942.1 cordon-bleu protein-like 1b isoform X2 [Rhincodon typus]XP_048454943.1 cordon-bleu protein-like 1b isoform X2 [Rhincodon typus]
MEQENNNVNTHFNLTVVLPGGVEHSTSINGSTPMMDLLIFLCGKYHLNPSNHTIELMGREKNQVQFKPNTLIGAVEVEKLILKQKNIEEKKTPISLVPEQTVRVVVNYKKTQKTIVRVSPLVPLQELVPVISNKCEFDPKSTILVKDFESKEPYDLTKSLKELGIREVYALDTSVGFSEANFQGGSIQQGQFHIPANATLEKENKGFFNIFRLSKKKREKPASAPATPLVSQQRPLGMSSASAYCPTYESNTLPSDLPKKRRAPAPPLSVSQSFPKDLTQQASTRPTSYVFPDAPVNSTEQVSQNMTGSSRQRVESLSGGVASTKKTKRKAPLPPTKIEDQNTQDNKSDSNQGSVDLCPSPDTADKASASKIPYTSADDHAGIGSECNLEEIIETEEIRAADIDDTKEAIVQKAEEVLCPPISTDGTSSSQSVQTSDPANSDEHCSYTVTNKEADIKSEGKINTAEDVCHQIVTEKGKNLITNVDVDLSMANANVEEPVIVENVRNDMHQGDSDGISTMRTMLPPDEGIAGQSTQTPEEKSTCSDARTSPAAKHSANSQPSNVTDKDNRKISDTVEINELEIKKNNSEESDKTVDFQNAHYTKTTESTVTLTSDTTLTNTSESTSEQYPQVNNFTVAQTTPAKQQNYVSSNTSADATARTLADKQDKMSINQPATESSASNDPRASLPTKVATRSPESPTKIPVLYKCESEPKPKPSNEITRDYIPKIGMTTYKIVPSKSLENEAFVTYGVVPVAEITDQQKGSYDVVPVPDTSKESTKLPGTLEEPLTNVIRELTAFHQGANFDKSAKGKSINSAIQTHHPETTDSKLLADSEDGQSKVLVNRRTQSTSERKMKPGSVFLQLHKRSSGQYVTSALARSSSLPSQSSLDRDNTFLPKEENGVSVQEVIPTNADDLNVIIPPPPEFAAISEGNAQKELPKSGETPISRPSIPPKVPKKPSIRVKLDDTKAVRTTVVAARTYSPTSPSPFALAVSSAVKKTQTNPTYCFKPRSAGMDSSTLSSPINSAERELHPALTVHNESSHNSLPKQTLSPVRGPEVDCYIKVGTEAQHIQPQLPSPLSKSKPALISQMSDPGEIHQAVLDAIRSGDGAAKLKKVDTLTTM